MYGNIPNELKQKALFCLWKYETRDGQKTKVPYKTNGYWASVNSATDFSSFDSVSKLVDKYSGIGIGVFNGYSAIDIDHCVTDGVPNEMATDIINTMQSYTELSPRQAPGFASSSRLMISTLIKTFTISTMQK